MIPSEVCARWRLTPGALLGDRAVRTWSAERDGRAYVLQHFAAEAVPDWRYPLRVAAALRAQGWPTPEPAEEPLDTPDGAWVLFHRLPGTPRTASPAEKRDRGRLLAEFHASASATGITGQRGGFRSPAEVVCDPDLARWLRVHEVAHPEEGRLLRTACDAAAEWFARHPDPAAPRSVIHGDFAPWNLLFDGDRLTGVLDFEISHHTFQVADFALSWRGYHDEVVRGYDEVRPLSDVEWALLRPVFHAWIFIGMADLLAAHHAGGGPAPDLRWQVDHLRKRSALRT